MTKLYKATNEIFHLTIPQNATHAEAIAICEHCYDRGHGDAQELLDTFDTEEEADDFARATEPEMRKSTTPDGNIQLTIKVCFINVVPMDAYDDDDILDTYYLNSVSAEQMADCATEEANAEEKQEDTTMENITKKYEFTGETKVLENGVTVHRIRALVKLESSNHSKVRPGDLGGWIESQKNLSHIDGLKLPFEDNAWIADEACAIGDAVVKKNAYIGGNSLVSGNAVVSDSAVVDGNAIISGNATIRQAAFVGGFVTVKDSACISGNAHVYNHAVISGNAEVGSCAVVDNNAIITGDAIIYGTPNIEGNAFIAQKNHFATTTTGGFEMRKDGWGWRRYEHGTTFYMDADGGIRVTCSEWFAGEMPLAEYIQFVKETFDDEKTTTQKLNQIAKVCNKMGVEIPSNLYEHQ